MPIKATTAVLTSSPGTWEVVECEFESPRRDELVVQVMASGLCHTDDHLATGDIPPTVFPIAGGHEGAGVVVEVGPETRGFEIGDHVVLAPHPTCGHCYWCSSGMQNLCDAAADLLAGSREDGTYRATVDGEPMGQFVGLSTFSNYTVVSTRQAVPIPRDLSFEAACLVGCGVIAGWGSAVNAAEVRPGDVVIVVGVGGVGLAAVQGAVHCGAAHVIAVDPVEMKREAALQMGARHAFADLDTAAQFARSITDGRGSDSAIVTIGVTAGEHLAQAFRAIRKAGIVVAAGSGSLSARGIPINPLELTLHQKRIQGALMGQTSPLRDIPLLLELYRLGLLKLDELITKRYALPQIHQAYEDMHAGKNLRGVIVHEH